MSRRPKPKTASRSIPRFFFACIAAARGGGEGERARRPSAFSAFIILIQADGRSLPPSIARRAAAPGYVWLITALDAAGAGARAGAVAETHAFLHADGLEPARFVALSLVLRDD